MRLVFLSDARDFLDMDQKFTEIKLFAEQTIEEYAQKKKKVAERIHTNLKQEKRKKEKIKRVQQCQQKLLIMKH
jgi:hypothetical protein